jgi:enoyl-CoA hydratase/carnithine racemase
VGKAKAMEMIFTARTIDAREALRIGLVHRVVEPDQVSETVLKIANEVASKGPIALRYAKEAINKGMGLTLDQGLRLEGDLYFLLHTTKDRTEGIRAFQGKRKPTFEGR